MFFGDIFTLLLQSILFWTSRKEIKLIQYKMDQKILWAVNKMPKTDDKNLPIMGLEEIKRRVLSTRAFLSTAKHH